MMQTKNVENVDFSFHSISISDATLVGIDLSPLEDWSDLSLTQAAELAAAVATQDLRLDMVVTVRADNPPENGDARLVRMDWSLLVEDRETVNGRIVTETFLARGAPTLVPVVVQVNLTELYQGAARDLFELALSLAGLGGEEKDIRLRVLPLVETAFGPIRYDRPLELIRERIGG
jgi:hypothetical protein